MPVMVKLFVKKKISFIILALHYLWSVMNGLRVPPHSGPRANHAANFAVNAKQVAGQWQHHT